MLCEQGLEDNRPLAKSRPSVSKAEDDVDGSNTLRQKGRSASTSGPLTGSRFSVSSPHLCSINIFFHVICVEKFGNLLNNYINLFINVKMVLRILFKHESI